MNSLPPPPPDGPEQRPSGFATLAGLAAYTVSAVSIGAAVIVILALVAGEGEILWVVGLLGVAFVGFRMGQIAMGRPAGTLPGSRTPQDGQRPPPPPPPPPAG